MTDKGNSDGDGSFMGIPPAKLAIAAAIGVALIAGAYMFLRK